MGHGAGRQILGVDKMLKAAKFLRKNGLPIAQKIIRISTIDANNISAMNGREERRGVEKTSVANYDKSLNLGDL
jgi:hypothetical protein